MKENAEEQTCKTMKSQPWIKGQYLLQLPSGGEIISSKHVYGAHTSPDPHKTGQLISVAGTYT